MSKFIPFALAGAGAAATSVGGVYLIKGTSSPEKKTPTPPELGFGSFDDFKKSNGGFCSEKYFGNRLSFSGTFTAVDANGNKIQDNHFTGASGDNSTAESCLMINWERTNSSTTPPGKWKGGFRWLWSFRKGTKGFVMFVATKPSSTDKTLDLKGGIYFVEETGTDSKTWSVQKHKLLPTDGSPKTLSKASFDNSFPKVGSDLKGDVVAPKGSTITDTSYWGFVKGKDDFENLCKEAEDGTCPNDPSKEQTFRGAWLWTFSNAEPNKSKKLSGWSETFDTWSNQLFGNADTNLKNALSTFTGAWTKHSVSANPS